MQGGDGGVGDDDGAFLRQDGGQEGAGAGDQAFADDDVVAGLGQGEREAAGWGPGGQGVEDQGGGVIGAVVTAIDDDVGFGVGRVALGHQFGEDFGGVAGVEQRAVGAAGDAAQEDR